MAKQQGILFIQGTIGNLSFYKSPYGFLVRKKGGVSAHRIANDPKFQRTRENMAEFGLAGNAGKQVRNAFHPLLASKADGRMNCRLTQTMMQVLKEDSVHPKGQRTVVHGNLQLLKGFEFNMASPLSNTLLAPFQTAVNRPLGTCSITLQPFVPALMVSAPEAATHFSLAAAAAAIHFSGQQFQSATSHSAQYPLHQAPTNPITLSCHLPPESPHPILLALGIQFYQQVNQQCYSLSNGAFNALSLVHTHLP